MNFSYCFLLRTSSSLVGAFLGFSASFSPYLRNFPEVSNID